MFSFFMDGGIFMWPLLVVTIVILYLTIRKIIDMVDPEGKNRDQIKNGINTILFWGGISVIIGIFAHFEGLYMAMQAIKVANDISPAIVANGYAMSLITILSGLVIFLASAIIWLVLNWWSKRIISAL